MVPSDSKKDNYDYCTVKLPIKNKQEKMIIEVFKDNKKLNKISTRLPHLENYEELNDSEKKSIKDSVSINFKSLYDNRLIRNAHCKELSIENANQAVHGLNDKYKFDLHY